jgi:hypothetical protein
VYKIQPSCNEDVHQVKIERILFVKPASVECLLNSFSQDLSDEFAGLQRPFFGG